jgi:hypothetical protein
VVSSLIAVVPTAGVLFMFWVGIRALVQADRRERQAQARIEAVERRDHLQSGRESGAGSAPAAGPERGSGSER